MKISDTAAMAKGPEREIPYAALAAFEATARLGSVSRAAAELHLTQSAVSQRLLKLEAFVGQRLFVRHGHGMRLTGAGELLVQTTRETLGRLRTGLARIEPYRNKASLLLACPADLAQSWLLPRLPALRRLHPALEVWMMSDAEVAAIDRVDVDLMISRRHLGGPDVECVPLLEDRNVAVCGPQWALKIGKAAWPRLLEKVPLLLLEREPEWGGLLSGLSSSLRLRRAATIQDDRLVLGAAEHELGLAYLSHWLVDSALAAGRLAVVPQVPVTARARIWLARSRLTPRTPLANQAFDWLLAEAAAA